MHVMTSDLSGKTVTTSEGRILGTIEDLVVEADGWKVTDVQIKVEKATAKDLGLKTPLFRNLLILVETARIASSSDQVVLNLVAGDFADYVNARLEEE